MTNCYAPGDRDDYMSVKKSVKKSKYERKMRKRNPEWGKSTPAALPIAPLDTLTINKTSYLEQIKPWRETAYAAMELRIIESTKADNSDGKSALYNSMAERQQELMRAVDELATALQSAGYVVESLIPVHDEMNCTISGRTKRVEPEMQLLPPVKHTLPPHLRGFIRSIVE